MRKNFTDDTAITKAVEKSTQSARELLRIINQPDSGKSRSQVSEEHHSEMSNKNSSDASETPCEVQPFHPWLMTLEKPSKEQQASNELFMTHQSGISFEKESWVVINNRWEGWFQDDWMTFVTKMSLLKFVVIDEMEAAFHDPLA